MHQHRSSKTPKHRGILALNWQSGFLPPCRLARTYPAVCVDIIPARRLSTEPISKLKFRRQLDRPRAADLIQRIEAARLYVTPVVNAFRIAMSESPRSTLGFAKDVGVFR